MSDYNYITLIDENDCIGDSLDTINLNYKNLDVGLTIQTAAITPLSAPEGMYYNIGTELGPLSARVAVLSGITGIFQNFGVFKNQNDTNLILYTNFTSGAEVEITTRYMTLTSSYINGNITDTSYADITKTIQGDFIINNADLSGGLFLGTRDTERVVIEPDGAVVIRKTADRALPSLSPDRLTITKDGDVGIGMYPVTLPGSILGAGYPAFPDSNTFTVECATDWTYKPTSTLWLINSDERIKHDIELANTQRCYDIVKTLPLKYYTWNEFVPGRDRSMLGWIAQDVKEVFPKGVKEKTMVYNSNTDNPTTVENCLTLDANQIYAALYGAVQQLMTIVEQQSAAIINLQKQLQNS